MHTSTPSASTPSADFRKSHDDHVTNPDSDEEAMQRLKELFENNAGVLTAGQRDTIDSIISKYERLRDEVKEEPRIGLALSMEFTTSSSHVSNVPLQPASDTEVIAPSEGYDGLVGDERRQIEEGATHQSVVDDAHFLQQVAIAAIEHDPASPRDTTRKYDTDDTDAAWDSQEDTLLDTYADPQDHIFHSTTGASPGADAVHAVDAKSTAERKTVQEWLSTTTSLSLIPIVQVAIVEPKMATISDKTAAEIPLPTSEDGQDDDGTALNEESISGFSIAPVTTLSPGLSTPASDACLSDTHFTQTFATSMKMPCLLNGLEGRQQRMEALPGIFIVPDGHMRSEDDPTDAQLNDGDDASDWLSVTSDTTDQEIRYMEGSVEETHRYLREYVGANDTDMKMKGSRHIAGTSSFLTWVEEDTATEYVLLSGLGVMLSAVVVGARILW